MPSSTPFQIIIVGGGIAGLSAAIALRSPGRQITVLERAHLISEIGATISLQPNASRIVLQEWKIDTLVEARGVIDQGMRIFNTEGVQIHSVPLVDKTEYGGDRVMYRRQDLHEALRRAAVAENREGDPVSTRTSAQVVDCHPEPGILTLKDGEQLQADLIVAADGIHSRLRDIVVGEHIHPKPSGLSAYRMTFETTHLEQTAPEFSQFLKIREPFTSMMVAYDCRLIMSAAAGGDIYSIVSLVPDDRMNEDPNSKQSWVSEGDLDRMLETYRDFPEWMKAAFRQAKNIGLWQLRDIDPLKTWTKGRVMLIGDAAHAMLPTQGQGACQAVEDAEALGAFLSDIEQRPSLELLQARLQSVFEARYSRATMIQEYSRMTARPATDKATNTATIRPDEFMDYNCMYRGAKKWLEKQRLEQYALA